MLNRGALAHTSPSPLGLSIVRAEGSYLYDKDGNRYLDLIAGLAVNNVGHAHPEVVAAIKEQVDSYLHVIPYGEFVQSAQVNYAEELVDNLPTGLHEVYFVNSGTEAIEAALKLAKRVTGRTKLVGFDKSYHGSTHGSLSITGNEKKRFRNRPLLPDTICIPFNDMDALKLIDDRTAAVVVEPIQGDAGVRIPSNEWMTALRLRAKEMGAMLIFDEVQTGFGRTGKLFAFEHFDIIPDILVLGKALGGGMPLGAFISSHERMNTLTYEPALGHITTFGGHPVSCAAGLAAFKILNRSGSVERSIEIGKRFRSRMSHPNIKDFRGIGSMMAIELDSPESVQKVVLGSLQKGVLGFWFLSCPEAFRLAPPLTITDSEIDHATQVILTEIDRI